MSWFNIGIQFQALLPDGSSSDKADKLNTLIEAFELQLKSVLPEIKTKINYKSYLIDWEEDLE